MKIRKKNKVERRKKGTLVTVALALLLFPIYIIARLLFKIAVEKENKSIILESEFMTDFTKFFNTMKKKKIEKRDAKDKECGKGFYDFYEQIERGKQWFLEQKRERITISSFDDLRLVAHYLPAEQESDKIIILMHGYRSDGYGDFSALYQFYHELGYHILLPHQRSHGDSEGIYICYGVKERFDVKQWVEYIVDRFGSECTIVLSGISMGATTVLMAAGLELPQQVKGIVADCGFTSPWDIFEHVIKRDYMLPPFPFLHIADLICKSKAGFRFRECSTLKSMEKNKTPILFIHGAEDRFVPVEMTKRCFDVCRGKKELLIVEGAAHGTSNLVAPDKYKETVKSFLEDCLWENL